MVCFSWLLRRPLHPMRVRASQRLPPFLCFRSAEKNFEDWRDHPHDEEGLKLDRSQLQFHILSNKTPEGLPAGHIQSLEAF